MQDTPQQMLPMPGSWTVSPDDTFKIPFTRGTRDWAPPRAQIIFTRHPTNEYVIYIPPLKSYPPLITIFSIAARPYFIVKIRSVLAVECEWLQPIRIASDIASTWANIIAPAVIEIKSR